MRSTDLIQLKIVIPTKTLVDRPARRVTAEGMDGEFGLLPHHIDYVAALVPGLFTFTDEGGRDFTLALDTGVLVKNALQVTVAARDGVLGENVDILQETVRTRFQQVDELERKARTAMARVEAAFFSRFMECREHAA